MKALPNKAFILWEHTGSNRGPSACKKESRLFYLFLKIKEYKNKHYKYLITINLLINITK